MLLVCSTHSSSDFTGRSSYRFLRSDGEIILWTVEQVYHDYSCFVLTGHSSYGFLRSEAEIIYGHGPCGSWLSASVCVPCWAYDGLLLHGYHFHTRGTLKASLHATNLRYSEGFITCHKPGKESHWFGFHDEGLLAFLSIALPSCLSGIVISTCTSSPFVRLLGGSSLFGIAPLCVSSWNPIFSQVLFGALTDELLPKQKIKIWQDRWTGLCSVTNCHWWKSCKNPLLTLNF